MKRSRIIVVICVIVLCFPFLYRMPYWIQQFRYHMYYRANDISIEGGYSGNGSHYYGYVAYRRSLGFANDPHVVNLGGAETNQSPYLTYVDINDDGKPEIHISGFDPASPGFNFYRFNESEKMIEVIPPDQVPKKWKDKFPEDQYGYHSHPWYDFWD